jgi:tripartite-type tricarboxylate transporter receptor subunit TctC
MQRPPCLITRRLAVMGVALFTILSTGNAPAQDYPNKPIRFIVPTPPGAGPDVDIRQMAPRLGQLLGQTVVIENRPGAAGRIATEAVVKSAPDGYTFLVGTPTALVTGPILYANLPYDARRDLVPVSLISTTAYALTVNANVPAQTAAAYVALAKSNQGFANAGTLGIGAATHLASAWFGAVTNTELKFIHYNTSTPFNDLMSGQISAIFEALAPVMGNVKAGRLRVLAISGKARHPLFPDVPTFAEAGYPAYDPLVWIGALAPAGTPSAIVNKVGAAIAQVAKVPEIIAQRRETVSESVGSTPAEFAAFLDAERAKWGAVIKQTGVKIEQ